MRLHSVNTDTSQIKKYWLSKFMYIIGLMKGSVICTIIVSILSFKSIYGLAYIGACNHVCGQALEVLGLIEDELINNANPKYETPITSNDDNKDIGFSIDSEQYNDNSDIGKAVEDNVADSSKEPFLVDPNKRYKLSELENSKLFFETDDYIINGEDAVIQEIELYISDIRSLKYNDNFDLAAPQLQKNELFEASILESIMENSDQLDEVIFKRLEVQNSGYKDGQYIYGKPEIAWLLSNNYQRYAQEYANINPIDYESVKYFYAKSISFAWLTISFDSIDDEYFQKVIIYISGRYKDIAYYAPEDSVDRMYSIVISNALDRYSKEQTNGT